MSTYEGPERRKSRQPAFDRLLHTVWGVVGILTVVASVSATVALSAQRYIGAPAANAKAITKILTTDSLAAIDRWDLHERQDQQDDDIAAIRGRIDNMESQHVDIYRELRRLGVIICASLGSPDDPAVRTACAALRNGD